MVTQLYILKPQFYGKTTWVDFEEQEQEEHEKPLPKYIIMTAIWHIDNSLNFNKRKLSQQGGVKNVASPWILSFGYIE